MQAVLSASRLTATHASIRLEEIVHIQTMSDSRRVIPVAVTHDRQWQLKAYDIDQMAPTFISFDSIQSWTPQKTVAVTEKTNEIPLQHEEAQAPEECYPPLQFTYTNYAGQTEDRKALPLRLVFGWNQWHAIPQWVLVARDPTKNNALRTFTLATIDWKKGVSQ